MSSRRPVSFHQPRTTCDSTGCCSSTSHWIASVISSSPRPEGWIARAASWMRGREHVDADQREVGGGLRGLLDQPRHAAVGVELGDAVVLRVRHAREQDQRLGLVAAEVRHQVLDAALEQVVAEVHHERVAAEERLRGQHGVREPERRVLLDVGDLDPELRAVAGRLADLAAGLGRDDDPDFADARGGHRLDAVEEHRLVGDGDELLRRRIGDRAQARALAAREDQALELLHSGRRLAQLAVIPGRDRGGDELQRDALARLRAAVTCAVSAPP